MSVPHGLLYAQLFGAGKPKSIKCHSAEIVARCRHGARTQCNGALNVAKRMIFAFLHTHTYTYRCRQGVQNLPACNGRRHITYILRASWRPRCCCSVGHIVSLCCDRHISLRSPVGNAAPSSGPSCSCVHFALLSSSYEPTSVSNLSCRRGRLVRCRGSSPCRFIVRSATNQWGIGVFICFALTRLCDCLLAPRCGLLATFVQTFLLRSARRVEHLYIYVGHDIVQRVARRRLFFRLIVCVRRCLFEWQSDVQTLHV